MDWLGLVAWGEVDGRVGGGEVVEGWDGIFSGWDGDEGGRAVMVEGEWDGMGWDGRGKRILAAAFRVSTYWTLGLPRRAVEGMFAHNGLRDAATSC